MKSKEMYAATKMADLTKFVDHFDRLTKFGKLKILFYSIDYYMHFCT